jgi:hypothetical protein
VLPRDLAKQAKCDSAAARLRRKARREWRKVGAVQPRIDVVLKQLKLIEPQLREIEGRGYEFHPVRYAEPNGLPPSGHSNLYSRSL